MKRFGKSAERKRIVRGLSFVLFTASVCPIFADTISIVGPTTNPNVGDIFDVSVNVTGINDLYAFQFDLTFDPSLLSVDSVTEGSFLLSGGTTIFIPGVVDNVGGNVTATADSLIGSIPGVTGNGALAVFQFTALASGTSPLSLSNEILLDSSLNDITTGATFQNSYVTVDAASTVPEPNYLSLLVLLGAVILLTRAARVLTQMNIARTLRARLEGRIGAVKAPSSKRFSGLGTFALLNLMSHKQLNGLGEHALASISGIFNGVRGTCLIAIAFSFLGSINVTAQTTPPGDAPEIMQVCAIYCATWTWENGYYYGVFSDGALADITVNSFTADSILMYRTDTPKSVSAGLTAVYTGKIVSPGKATGSVTWTWPGHAGYPSTGAWTGTWNCPISSNSTAACAPLSAASSLPAGQAGNPYPLPQQTAALVTGGTPPYNTSQVSGFPAGLAVDSTGLVSGQLKDQVPDTYQITGTVSDFLGSSVSINVTLKFYCGNPQAGGDDRDALIAEYLPGELQPYPSGVDISAYIFLVPALNVVPPSAINAPRCNDWTQTVPITPSYPSFCDFTSKGTEPYCAVHQWTLVRSPEVAPIEQPPSNPGIENWLAQIRSAGDEQYRMITSSYRDPLRNLGTIAASGRRAATLSRHMQGDAIDLQNITQSYDEYLLLSRAAHRAGANYIEPFTKYCKSVCVHADWRFVPGDFVNP